MKKLDKIHNIEFFQFLSIALGLLVLILLVVFFSMYLSNSIKNTNIIDENKKMENKIVVLETNLGNIEIELFLNESPITAGNFKKLVEEGFYDNTKFHRVIKDFMIQGGDPLSKNDSLKNRWGTGGPGYVIKDEFIKGLSNKKGTISMANSGPNSGGSQFFINLVDNTFLDWDKQPLSSKHPVFGKVISGMEIVDTISKTQRDSSDRPINNVIILKTYIK